MSVREYIGARYVPIVVGEWDNTRTYEPLMVVTHQGNSYTSRQYVPAGIEITNESYWVLSANYNAQVEAYRQEVATLDGQVTANTNNIANILPMDTAPTQDSTKGVTSGGVYEAVTKVSDSLDKITPLDTTPTQDSTKGVTSGGVYEAVNDCLNTTAFPNTTYIIANRNRSINGAVDFWFTNDFKWYYPLSLGNKIFDSCDSLYINKVNDFYYLWTNDYYAVSKDFKNWTTYNQGIGGGVPVWGACFVPDSNYIIGSRRYIDTQTATNPFGETYFFVPFYVTYSQNETTGQLTFSDASNFTPPNFTLNVSSYIDPSIVKIGNTYYIVFKDEITTKAVLYTATDIINTSKWSSVNFDCPLYGYEAPKLIVNSSNNTINMLVSYYNMNAYILQQFSDKTTNPAASFTNEPVLFLNVFNNPSTRYVLISKYNELMNCRHCAPYKVDAIIAQAFNFNKIPYQPRMRTVTLNTSKYIGIYIPGTQWQQIGNNQGILEFSASQIFIDDMDNYGTIYSGTGSTNASITLSGNKFVEDWRSKQILSFGDSYKPYTIKPGQSFITTTAIRSLVQIIGAC